MTGIIRGAGSIRAAGSTEGTTEGRRAQAAGCRIERRDRFCGRTLE